MPIISAPGVCSSDPHVPLVFDKDSLHTGPRPREGGHYLYADGILQNLAPRKAPFNKASVSNSKGL